MTEQGYKWLEDNVKQLYRDMYLGNGKPGITTRMQQSEDRHESTENKLEKIEKYFLTIMLSFFGLVMKAVWDIITSHH